MNKNHGLRQARCPKGKGPCCKTDDLSSVRRTHAVIRKNRVPQVILWPPHTHQGTHAYAIHIIIQIIISYGNHDQMTQSSNIPLKFRVICLFTSLQDSKEIYKAFTWNPQILASEIFPSLISNKINLIIYTLVEGELISTCFLVKGNKTISHVTHELNTRVL